MSENQKNVCSCACGNVSYQVPSQPLLRVYCHCSICQNFNNAPYGDILVYRAAEIDAPDKTLVKFDTYRPPPNVQRGKCISCLSPAIELLNMSFFPKLIIVPASMHNPSKDLIAAKAHVFYEGRRENAEDDLPKYSGYLKSQLAFGRYLLPALISRG